MSWWLLCHTYDSTELCVNNFRIKSWTSSICGNLNFTATVWYPYSEPHQGAYRHWFGSAPRFRCLSVIDVQGDYWWLKAPGCWSIRYCTVPATSIVRLRLNSPPFEEDHSNFDKSDVSGCFDASRRNTQYFYEVNIKNASVLLISCGPGRMLYLANLSAWQPRIAPIPRS